MENHSASVCPLTPAGYSGHSPWTKTKEAAIMSRAKLSGVLSNFGIDEYRTPSVGNNNVIPSVNISLSVHSEVTLHVNASHRVNMQTC